MRILVTGANGMLGRDLVAHLAPRHDVIGVDLEVDITDPDAIGACVREVAPAAIFNCAAWTDVDAAEADEPAAARVNGSGVGNLAAAAARARAALVHPSTDYVFDGSSPTAYREDDPPNPIGAYGRTKLAGERAALSAWPAGARIARTAWLYGAAGRNFIDTMRRLGAERDQVAVVADQTGSPTWTKDLAGALEALLDRPPGIYHTTGAGTTTWADLAAAVFARAGLECQVRRITTAELGRPAPRPANSALAVTRPGAPRLRHWSAALDDYLKETP